MSQLLKASKEDKRIIREIAKNHSIKGVNQALHAVIAGNQTVKVEIDIANDFVNALQDAGFVVEDGWQGPYIDTFLIWKAA